MGKAVSLFIMDVTKSSNFKNGLELTEYLTSWQRNLDKLNEFVDIKVKYRMGDEIICLVEDYFTAFVIANYMQFNWKYKNNKPYFGISCGIIEDDIKEIDIEIWNNPMIKEARIANDYLKQEKTRNQLIFWGESKDFEKRERELINLLLQLQSDLINRQTEKQREITSLYSILGSQKEISKRLGRTPSTISSHFNGGKTDLILDIYDTLVSMLNLKQALNITNITGIQKVYASFKKNLDERFLEMIIAE